MANNFENFDFNQNALCTNGVLGFHEGSNGLPITPSPSIPQNNESPNSVFLINSLKNQGSPENFGKPVITSFHEGQHVPFVQGSHGILSGFKDFIISHPTVQQNNMEGKYTHMSNARSDNITFTYPPSGQISAPIVPDSLEIWSGINHIGSSYDSFNNHENTANTSINLSGSANKVNRSQSGRKSIKRTRFRFVPWTKEEEDVMDRELLKFSFLPFLKICIKMTAFLPERSIRDIAMRMQSLIKHEKLDDIWGWLEPSPNADMRDLTFYLPDNPNDPDLLAIQNRFPPRATERSRV